MLGSFRKNEAQRFLKTMIIVLGFTVAIETQSQANLLVNGDFSLTNLSGHSYQYFYGSMAGWNCTLACEVDDCLLLNDYYQTQGSFNANCTGKIVDLISFTPENLTQSINLTTGNYLLSLNYYYPRANAMYKTFQVFFNEQLVFNDTPNFSFKYQKQYIELEVTAKNGLNLLRLTTIRNYGFDVFGFTVNNLSLVVNSDPIADNFSSLINSTIVNSVSVVLTQIPGSRVFFGDIMSYFIHFDRLQFYYFHNRNYSRYSSLLLCEINVLNNFKGILLQNIYQLIEPNFGKKIDSFFSTLDYKLNYSSAITLLRNQNNGGGFISNCYSFLVYSVPGVLITYSLMLVVFRLIQHQPASRLIRKYSFLGIILAMLFEGNIESFTYYSIGQFMLFFSANYHHKMINIFIVLFQWLVTTLSIGSILWFRYYYGKKICYFVENRKLNMGGMWCQTIDHGIVCLLFGIIHQIMYFHPNLQLLVLFLIQGVWLMCKVTFIYIKTYHKTFSVFILSFNGLLRMCFIITFYFYEEQNQMRVLINNSVHKVLVAIMLLLWLQEFIISFIQLLIFYNRFWKRLSGNQSQERKDGIQFNCKAQHNERQGEKEKISKRNSNHPNSIKIMKRNPIVRQTNQKSQFDRIKVIRERIARMVNFQGQRNYD